MAKYKVINTSAKFLMTAFGKISVASPNQEILQKMYSAGSIYVAPEESKHSPENQKADKTKTK